MRIDLIPERDRFIPGWHNRPEPCCTDRLPLQWQWPKRLLGVIQILPVVKSLFAKTNAQPRVPA